MIAGQAALKACQSSAASIAAALGVSRQVVTYWRQGTRVPGPDAQRALETHYGIPARSWSQRVGADPAPPSEPPPEPPRPKPARAQAAPLQPARSGSTLDAVEQLIADLARDAQDASLPSEIARVRTATTQALALRSKIEAVNALFESEAILKHPGWRKLRAAMVDALRPYPDAARAVADALGRVET